MLDGGEEAGDVSPLGYGPAGRARQNTEAIFRPETTRDLERGRGVGWWIYSLKKLPSKIC